MNMATPQPDIMSEQLRQTTCPYCGVGCGVDISCNVSKRAVTLDTVKGTPEHPANFGRLCVKGTNLLETNDLNGRLLHPTMAGKSVDWDTATDVIADKIASTIAQYGADAVAFYVSGQLLTEDYYIANKLMKGYIGSANIDTNSRLCMSSAVAAYKRAFGEDVVPCDYTDLECTDLLVITGSNAAWAHPVLFQRIQRAKLKNPLMKVVVIDPRKTETCTIADLHLAIKPGSDVALFNGLLRFANKQGRVNKASVGRFADGLDEALESASASTLSEVAKICDVDASCVKTFYEIFCQAARAITFYSMGVNQSSAGVDKAQAIINCHLATDLIAKEGCGPFSITGQPNAMGGREVGGLANMLAAHMDLENPEHINAVKTYWNAPVMPKGQGLKAVDLFNAIERGKVKFVWIMGTNPVVSMPNRAQVERALSKCDMVVVSDIVESNDTLKYAHIALPATGWSEKDGTVTNSERRISRQRGILPPPGSAKHDWQIMCDVAVKMGFAEAFNFTHPSQIFCEYAGLTGYQNNGQRQLDLSPLQNITQAQYDAMSPLQWPFTTSDELQGMQGLNSKRPFADKQFSTPNGKAKLIPVVFKAPQQQTSKLFPFVVNSGRARDQWHTMTRTGKAAKLLAHMPRAYVYINPKDTAALGVENGALVSLSSAVCNDAPVIYPVKADTDMREGEVFIPIHWSAQWGSHSKLGALYDSAVDPISGQPELKHAAVAIAPVHFATYGKLFISSAMQSTHTAEIGPFNEDALKHVCHYWSKTPLERTDASADISRSDAALSVLNVASNNSRRDFTQSLIPLLPQNAVLLQFHHLTYSVCLALVDDILCFAAFLGDEPEKATRALAPAHIENTGSVPNSWLASLLNTPISTGIQRNLLRGQVDDAFLNGDVVCSCFEVREKTITHAIEEGCSSVVALGKALKCGTNCGSCKPALSKLIDKHLVIETQSV
ncbi:molybdopterin-dependent oxidoreductase [Alteromonas sp. IB21]|uniref:nitrate reductase n=1 Tax=Alteromonas sp. IB21 TaxID=2779369 RepID=UPI0018E83D51|nr:nitrate reductase [Alteromonas sp. IB21]MBJ2128197.1 molybdopterin-dependent oxidoreductase [Alteromonas sp. IB21]